ncbi:hypothetical protein BHM03_00038878 [Ensete ventricosum]|nr:hypothetical protein BHM03_00038878 [Ensete ventricosum]
MAGLCVTGDGASVGATGDRTRTKKDEDEDPVEVYYTDGKEEGKTRLNHLPMAPPHNALFRQAGHHLPYYGALGNALRVHLHGLQKWADVELRMAHGVIHAEPVLVEHLLHAVTGGR